MLKELKRYQVQTMPFQAVRNWELNNTQNESLLLFESTGSDDGEPIDFEYIDYGDGSSTPYTSSECELALEQQEADQVNYREGKKVSGIFYENIDPINIDGTYQRSVYSQIKTSFYNTYRNPTQLFGMENIDFENGKTKRKLAEKLRLFDVPRHVFGDKIVPSSVIIYNTTLDNDYIIKDDGYGNLMAGTNIFSRQQEIGDFINNFENGYDSSCCVYFGNCITISTGSVPTGSVPTGSVPTGSITSSCIPPLFEAITYENQFLTPAGASVDYTFAGTSGSNIAIYAKASTTESVYPNYIYPDITLYDPGMTIVGADDGTNGWTCYAPFNDYNPAGISKTLASTGTYTVRLKSYYGGETGNYDLYITDGMEKQIDGLGSIWRAMYVSSTKKIFALSGFANYTASIHVIDSQTEVIVNTVNLVTASSWASSARPVLFYNPNDDSVWASSLHPDFPTSSIYLFHRLDPSTGTLLESFRYDADVDGGGVSVFPGYHPTLNKLFGNDKVAATTTIKVYNCSTRNYEANLALDGPAINPYCKYISDIDKVLVVPAGDAGCRYQLINNLGVIEAGINTDVSYQGFYRNGLYYTTCGDIRSVDLSTGTIANIWTNGNLSAHGFEYNPCRDCIMVGWGFANDLIPTAAYGTADISMTNFRPISSLVTRYTEDFMVTGWATFVWNPETSRMYYFLAGNGLVQTVPFILYGETTGSAHVLS